MFEKDERRYRTPAELKQLKHGARMPSTSSGIHTRQEILSQPEIWKSTLNRLEKLDSLHDPLYLPILQLIAYERAISRGLDPDPLTNLTTVVVLND